MTEYLFLIVGSASLGLGFAEISQIPQAFASFLLNKFNIGKSVKGYDYIKVPYRLKPFDCGYCLSFWTGLISSYYFGYDLIVSLMIGFVAGIVSILIKRIL